MDNEEWLNEYIMADTGLIWRGSHNRMRPCYWNFAQFEKDILECCVYLISRVSKLSIAGRADPVRVTRAISAVVRFRLLCSPYPQLGGQLTSAFSASLGQRA